MKQNSTGRLALVDEREEALRRVHHEIGDRHLAGHDESGRSREQADGDEHAADDLDDAGEAEQREQRRAHADIGEADQLRRAVGEEQERRHDAQDREKMRTVGRQVGQG
jgi:hypothetical protein